jgi:intracellular sulfur oxidation DsrE/DsrF family protein
MMRMLMGALTALALGQATPVRAEPGSVVALVTSAEAQTQFMAMVLTIHAVKAGAAASVLLCGPAGDMALRAAPEAATAPLKPSGLTPQGLMQDLMKAGATVQVCAVYLPNRGLAPDALIDGVTVATPPAMAAGMMADGARVWSF